jgi:two-component system, LuxR family, sensor kinase FixL
LRAVIGELNMGKRALVMNPLEIYLVVSEAKRIWVYATAGLLVAVIAYMDWRLTEVSLGFLYIIPVLMVSAVLRAWQIVVLAIGCGVLREWFGNLHTEPGAGVRAGIGAAGFALAGYFVSQLNRQRRTIAQHFEAQKRQAQALADAERQLRAVIDTSPLAILTLNGEGRVILANASARHLLSSESASLSGETIDRYLPILRRFLNSEQSCRRYQTVVESRGQRADGETFLAHIWLSTFESDSHPCLAAFIWDESENLRDREGTGLDTILATSRVVIGMISHEIRNLAGAASAAYKEITHGVGSIRGERLNALGTVIEALENIATSGLRLASHASKGVADLGMVLDETRVFADAAFREIGGAVHWEVPDALPLVEGDHHGLLQVFLNLARNSEAAIKDAPKKILWVNVTRQTEMVLVRFLDTGPGVAEPDSLFRPFQPGAHSSGLGLYLSRAVLKSYGGDLFYEPVSEGACFAVQLWCAADGDRAEPSSNDD